MRLRSSIVLAALTAAVLVITVPATSFAAGRPAGGTIATLAGTGQVSGPSGDGGPAANAVIDTPSGVAIDAAGNTYVSEYWSSRVRKISPAGVITTVAGTGSYGSGPDGGLATATKLKAPTGLAVDGQGNLYIADRLDSRVRKVTPLGLISTVAGNGTYGFSGDGGLASAAVLNGPYGVAAGRDGTIAIADTDNNRIRVVGTDNVIRTVFGNGVAASSETQVSHPQQVAVMPNGDFAVADTGNNRVVELITGSDYTMQYINGNGTAGAGLNQLNHPSGVGTDAAGNIYIADTGNNRIVVHTSNGFLRPGGGSGTAGFTGDGGQAILAQLNAPVAVAVDATASLTIADQGNNRLRTIAGGPLISTIAGKGTNAYSGDGGPATQAAIGEVAGVAVDPSGNVYTSDDFRSHLSEITPDGTFKTVASGSADLYSPTGITIDRNGNLYDADWIGDTITRWDPAGHPTKIAGTSNTAGYSGDGGPATSATLNEPSDVAVDAAGNVYVLDSGNQRVRKIAADGTISTIAGTGTAGFSGDGGPATAAQVSLLGGKGGIAVDGHGTVYFTDTKNDRIRRIGVDGVISTIAGSTVAGDPATGYPQAGDQQDNVPATSLRLGAIDDVTVDAAGNVYTSIAAYHVVKIGPDGISHTLGGVGVLPGDEYDFNGDFGDGGPAALAEIRGGQLAVDNAGNIYLTAAGKIRKITAQ
jgi:hypothetical protein